MKRLPRKLATRWTHEVACWLEFERSMGTFGESDTIFGKWSVGENLAGACWIASAILRRVLEVHGYRAGVVYDACNGHAFVVTECDKTLDPTMGQFSVQYGFSAEVHVGIDVLPHDIGIVPRALFHAEEHMQGPSWPGFFVDVIERVLRRMGVEGLEA